MKAKSPSFLLIMLGLLLVVLPACLGLFLDKVSIHLLYVRHASVLLFVSALGVVFAIAGVIGYVRSIRQRQGRAKPVFGALFGTLVVLYGGYTVHGANRFRTGVSEVSSWQGQAAPAFQLTSLDGEALSKEGLAGKWIMLNFWATWCAPCVAEVPDLIELSRTRSDLVVIGFSQEQAATVQKFRDRHKVNYPLAALSKAQFDALPFPYGQARFPPHTFVISPDGQLVKVFAGMVRLDELAEITGESD